MVGVAVAGLGEIGRLHARHLAGRVPGARLVRLVDQAPRIAAALSAELDVPWSGSYADAVEDPQVDAVVIATPTPAHVGMVEGAAAAGKHAFCEKPLSLDLEGGRAATRSMRAAGLRLQVGFQRRFDPGWIEARKRIAAGEVGDIELMRVSHRNRDHPHGGRTDRLGTLFVDMTVHDMDGARWLGGEIEQVHAFASPVRGAADADTAVIVLRFRDGGLGVIDDVRRAGYGFECSAEVLGTRSTLRWGADGRGAGLDRLTPGGLTAALPVDHIARHRAAYLDEMCDFVECVRAGREPRVGGEDSIAALSLALDAERSWNARR